MQIPVSEAKAQLAELVRRAEVGEDVVLTRHGHPAVRLVPIRQERAPESRRKILETLRESGRAKASAGPDGARSQDFLYGEDGLPK